MPEPGGDVAWVGGMTLFAQIVRSDLASFIEIIICSKLYLETELYCGCSAYIETIPVNYQEDGED